MRRGIGRVSRLGQRFEGRIVACDGTRSDGA
jgi:hypothetical protein